MTNRATNQTTDGHEGSKGSYTSNNTNGYLELIIREVIFFFIYYKICFMVIDVKDHGTKRPDKYLET